MSAIRRLGSHPRWSDVVIHRGVARWVEVAEDRSTDCLQQTRQVLRQIDETLQSLSADRSALLQILVFVTDLAHMDQFNAAWDAWVLPGAAPVRACVQAGLAGGCLVEVIIEAVVPD
ncbi:MAG: RidA family protein [Planctomycetota bacterium]